MSDSLKAPHQSPQTQPSQVNEQEAPGQTTSPYIVVEQATKSYQIGSREVLAVRGVSLQVYRGELVALRGRSGSGKTTLLNLLGGLDRPTSGRVLVGGQDVGALSESELVAYRRKTVGFVFQHFALISIYSALENIILPLRIAGYSKAEATARALSCLERIGLEARQHHHPTELSGGEQQRIGIARALAIQPAVLLADEPTGNLDLRTGVAIMRLLRQIAEENQMAVLVATHDLALMQAAHRVLELRDGQLIDEGQTHKTPSI